MNLFLCHHYDASALYVYNRFRRWGLTSLYIITPEELLTARKWQHLVATDKVSTAVTLQNGLHIDFYEVNRIFNRLQLLEHPFWKKAPLQENEFAHQELTSFYLSWLYSLNSKVFNRPSAMGLSGNYLTPLQWKDIALKTGMAVSPDMPDMQTPTPYQRQLIVFQQKVYGPFISKQINTACIQLAQQTGHELLSFSFRQDENGKWLFHNASSFPDLTTGGDALLKHIYSTFLN
ncbi:hypothetical protein ECE50_008125 [Chitinophaga sp. Mgbs1]|uniref:Uncharacterized protein n=1 Tax=Chitinophaga solisilvae TaxID=1233460 RepID=A0A433WH58_9BACT|nr:hypothetical protein [Chitinophaga solisilvae]